jgi:carbamoyl-phosphate synthase large subunit
VITVLVTGCGGAIGLSAVKALRMGSINLRLIGVDVDPYAACFYLKSKEIPLHKAYIVPRADHPNYIPELINLCRREKVDVVFPCTDAELEKLSISKIEIAKSGTKIVISPAETIRVCRDKWLTYHHLNKYLPMVKSSLPDVGIEKALQFTGLPAIIKPRLGWGSRDIHKVESAEEAQIVISRIHKPIIQTWMQGEEYTVDGLTDRYGKVICIVPRRRIKILSGLSLQGITVRDKKLIELGEKITRCLNIVGPFNFQVRKINGEPKIFEINPRFAGTGILSVKAGVNIPLLAVKEACNMRITTNIDFDEGLVVSRYFEEVFFNISELKSHEN